MELKNMVGMIVGITVCIILFVAVLAPIIATSVTDPDGEGDGVAPVTDTTWVTLISVCGTLTVIAILMVAVRSLGNKA